MSAKLHTTCMSAAHVRACARLDGDTAELKVRTRARELITVATDGEPARAKGPFVTHLRHYLASCAARVLVTVRAIHNLAGAVEQGLAGEPLRVTRIVSFVLMARDGRRARDGRWAVGFRWQWWRARTVGHSCAQLFAVIGTARIHAQIYHNRVWLAVLRGMWRTHPPVRRQL